MILFRVDANTVIASGHLMRCIAIAEAVRKQGEDVLFLLAEDCFTQRLQEKNIKYKILHTNWRKMEEELAQWEEIVEQYHPSWIVVDSYQVTETYLEKLSTLSKVMYIDDEKKYKYSVDALLRYIEWEQEEQYRKEYEEKKTAILYGLAYVPLREEFYPNIQNHEKKTLLITTGGTDGENIGGRIIEKLAADLVKKQIHCLMIVGGLNQYQKELQQLAKEYAQVTLLYDVRNMGDCMRQADFAISAGGSTLYELCACQVPTICYSVAENQVPHAKALAKEGVIAYAGDIQDGIEPLVEKIVTETKMWMNRQTDFSIQREKMGCLIDGKGCIRIAEFLIEHRRQNKEL